MGICLDYLNPTSPTVAVYPWWWVWHNTAWNRHTASHSSLFFKWKKDRDSKFKRRSRSDSNSREEVFLLREEVRAGEAPSAFPTTKSSHPHHRQWVLCPQGAPSQHLATEFQGEIRWKDSDGPHSGVILVLVLMSQVTWNKLHSLTCVIFENRLKWSECLVSNSLKPYLSGQSQNYIQINVTFFLNRQKSFFLIEV